MQKLCKVLLCHAPTRSKRLGPPADALNWLSLSQHTTPDAWHGLHWNSWHETQLLVVTLPGKLDARSFSHLLACPRHLCRWHPSGSHFPVQLWKVCWNLSRYRTCKNEKLHKHMRARQCSLISVRILGVSMSFAVVQFGYNHESDTYVAEVAYASWLKRHSSPNLQLPLSRKS